MKETGTASARNPMVRCNIWWGRLCVLLVWCACCAEGLGYMSSIAAAYGNSGLVCAIEASGEQIVLCWGSNSSQVVQASSTGIALLAITGGDGFLCGLKVNTQLPFCWKGNWWNQNTVPSVYTTISYSSIAAGESHVCAIRSVSAKVDCWGDDYNGETKPPNDMSTLESIVAGRRFTCGVDSVNHRASCWGSSATSSPPSVSFDILSAGVNHVCGIERITKAVVCWGDNSMAQSSPPQNLSFATVTTGLTHSCGIREDSHEIVCWGNVQVMQTSFPSGTAFLALTSAPNMTCGVREDDLLAVCWGSGVLYKPPLELFSPGICTPSPCRSGDFHFNASVVGLPSSTDNMCLDPSQQICSPCAQSCPVGMFISSNCTRDGDRACTHCSLCQADLCRASCSLSAAAFQSPATYPVTDGAALRNGSAARIIGAGVAGGFFVAVVGAVVLCWVYRKRACWARNKHAESGGLSPPGSNPGSIRVKRSSYEVVRMQAFRLAELREATNGFKELNELGRGSYGFVYKAMLADGRQVAVKRANAARRIRSNSRDFEAELEVLCKVHHAHLVNLIGYCEEMGERLLVYEFMPHGTLHDHLHGGLAQLNWNLRLKIIVQAARGIEYLHRDANPSIIHRDIKSSNILLDADWGARVADFGLMLPEREKGTLTSLGSPSEVAYLDPEYLTSLQYTDKSDIYSFGVVLLEILCGRKTFDSDFDPANIVTWAVPFIQQGKTASIIDRSLEFPKNVDPLIRVAEIAGLCVRPIPDERPSMSEIASWLELVSRSSCL